MIVMKFGGSSVAGAERIRAVAELVRGRLAEKPVVVVSAFRGVTDDLLALAKAALKGDREGVQAVRRRHNDAADELGVDRELVKEQLDELSDLARGISLLKELTPRTLDYAAGFGERLSSRLIAAYLTKAGIPARQFDAHEAGLLTDARHGSANPLPEADAELKKSLGTVKETAVVTGFIGRAPSGDMTTLGRNGSDYTAAILGAALGAREIQIWSDTDGIMTADPRLVPEARPIASLSFEEASELAYYGGKVLHPHTLVPAIRKGIPIRVLNTFKPDLPGTSVLAKLEERAKGPRSIAFRRHLSVVSVTSPRMLMGWGFLARIFEVFARLQVAVDMVTTSEVTVSVTVDDPRRVEEAARELGSEFEVTVEKDMTIVCVVGDGIRAAPGIAGEVFSALRDAAVNVSMISQGASKINLAFVVADADVPKAVQALHRRFFP
ncbi:MAG: aspartate kinase [Elusimicrobia bacterium]|nr:aspartate kinase [Elusimicrobiota bacterium]